MTRTAAIARAALTVTALFGALVVAPAAANATTAPAPGARTFAATTLRTDPGESRGSLCEVEDGWGKECFVTHYVYSIGIRNMGSNPVEVKRYGDPDWYRVEPGERMELNGLNWIEDHVTARGVGGNSIIKWD
jgi:hypothetical protein